MLKIKNTFGLDHLKTLSGNDKPIRCGLMFQKILADGSVVNIAVIRYDRDRDSCYIKTIDDRLQTYVVLEDQFKDFIYLIDEAYYLIELVNRPIKDDPTVCPQE